MNSYKTRSTSLPRSRPLVERYVSLGVDVAEGEAGIVTPREVEITGHGGTVQRLTARSIVIATGARPAVPPTSRALVWAHEVTVHGIDDLDRAIADGEAHGFVKVLTVPGKDRILGVTSLASTPPRFAAAFVCNWNG